ncbi:glucose-methanol-choline oxidoreductase [Burkholderia lata]|nr:glucose-methanol-choline oxidoreductase [Burkholderia lata]
MPLARSWAKTMSDKTFDYVIIGAGSAGCTIATNLIERRKGTVLLIEAGGHDKDLFIHMPGGLGKAIPRYTWPYAAEPSQDVKGRSIAVPQGRVLGGSSSVNGMLYVRGHRNDYDRWETEFGCKGWGADEMLRYFAKAENNESLTVPHHGNDGHLKVTEIRYRHPLSQAFVRAGQQMGLEYLTDYNGDRQEGVGFYQATIFNGERGSTAATYLKAIRNHAEFKLEVDALVERIEIEGGRATGVTYRQGNRQVTVHARAEVIVTAGAIGSPKILQLSGIGPRSDLENAGVRVKHVLPVGENFHDHMHTSVNASIKTPISLYGQDRGLRALKHGLQWMLFRSGLLTSPVLEGFAFVDTCNQGQPDVQFHFLPVIDAFDDPFGVTEGRTHGITIKTGHLQPYSRGRVTIRSSNPADLPRIDGRYLSDRRDVDGQVRATKLALRMLQQPALAAHVDEVFSPTCIPDDTAAIEDWVRGAAKTVYHPVGTCRMGMEPASSVVDTQLRVHGIAGLRVADSSTMPSIPSGNTNAPTIALAEKASDLISNASH